MHARPVQLLAALGAVAALVLTAAGCGGDGDNGAQPHPDTEVSATPFDQAASPAADAEVIAVKVDGEEVTPSGVKVEVKVGQPIVFQIEATEPGELHVHTSPAQSIQYPAGKSQAQVTVDRPGEVEAEIEETGELVVLLEAR